MLNSIISQLQLNKSKNLTTGEVVAVVGSKVGSKTKVRARDTAWVKAKGALGTTPIHGTSRTVNGRSDRIGVAITTSINAVTITAPGIMSVITVVPTITRPGSVITVEHAPVFIDSQFSHGFLKVYVSYLMLCILMAC